MVPGWPTAVGAGLALLILGILIHRAWVSRPDRRGEQQPVRSHYLSGLNHLISKQPDLAVAELSRAVRTETDAVEAYLALGNLFREKGQTERAIDIHKSLLHRPKLAPVERLQVLLSLGLDFKKAGLMDRAERTLREVVERDPENVSGWLCLRQVYEEMGAWKSALEIETRVQELTGERDPGILAALHTEWGRAAIADDRPERAEEQFRRALNLVEDHAAARIGLAECRVRQEDDAGAIRQLEEALEGGPPWAAAALGRMVEPCERTGELDRLEAACERLLGREPRSWRVRLVKGKLHRRRGEFGEARDEFVRALHERPDSLRVQRALWTVAGADGQGDDGREEILDLLNEAIDGARQVDPYVCMRCGFKSVDIFVRCPHCHQWDTAAEEAG